ncbi:MAG TPA: Ig-like domain-containing protein [Thermoanaerobaculia bacterium]|nr:Ig-like domain-containing protein [Thermoanaerobaculia bacterium]
MSGFSRSTRLALTLTLAFVLVTFGLQPAWAVKAYPKSVIYYQPDGTPFEAHMIGDERIVFIEDSEGRTVIRDKSTGWYLYADPASHHTDQLRPSKYRPGKEKAPADFKAHVRPNIDAAKLPGPPFVQQDDGTIGQLFRSQHQQAQTKNGRFNAATNAASLAPTTVPVLVILVEFSDWKHTNGVGTPVAGEPDFNPMPGQPNSAPTWATLLGDRNVAGGLNHFYWEATYNRMQWDVTVAQRGKGQNGTGTLINDGWYVNPNTMAYWGAAKAGALGACDEDKGSTRNGVKDLIAWAIQQADADVNFAQYDANGDGSISDAELMIFVVHARDGQEQYGSGCDGSDPLNNHIWSHKWNIAANIAVDGKTVPTGHIYAIEPEFSPEFNYSTSPWTITDKFFGVGVFAHEALHTLGATDIYDTGYDATPAGEWDLMDSGSYNGARSGTHPAHMGSELKQDIKMNADTDANSYGFILESEITDVATVDGVKNVAPLGGSSPVGVLARVKSPNNANEWFLIENRAAVGYYEPYLPEHGLVIWHRDKAATVGNNSYPYEANVLRKGWANTATGLQTAVTGAAFSLDDNETSFTATTDPSNKLNSGSASGVKDIRCISAEASSMSFAYGTVTGAHVAYAGATVTGGDGDEWLDAGETASLNVNVMNSSCAGAAASNVTAVVTSANGTVSASVPASVASLAPGQTATFSFNVSLTCATCDAAGFDYVIYAGGTAVQSGSFTKPANRSYLWFDDVDAQAKAGWSSTTSFVPSACTTVSRHGDWSVVQHPTAPRGNSFRAPVASNNLTYTNPDEVWISPNITIPPGTDVRDFRFSYAAEIPCSGYTRGRLWVSTDNGVSWTRHEDFYRDAGDLSWEEVTTSLSPYAGATQLRFMFGVYTYTCQTGCTATRGVYVDNIGVIVSQGGSTPADTIAPVTAITSPASGATVSGTTSVTASASDNTGVTRVDFLVDGAVAASDSSSPYSFSWNTTTASNGTHSLSSRAYDAAGNSAASASVTVTVSNTTADTTAPTASITSPASGATVSGTTTVSANATDNVGVTRVEFYVDGVLASTDTSSPYSFAWNTTTATNASHSLSAKAFDAAGNAGTSSTVTVTVNNSTADVTAPIISSVTSVVTNSKNGSFEIRWTTNEPATSVVILNGTTYNDTALVTSHVRAFRGSKGATYTYTVQSTDAAGNTAQAGPFTHQN